MDKEPAQLLRRMAWPRRVSRRRMPAQIIGSWCTRARKRLFLTLSDLIDPAFQGEESDDYYSGQLIREVRLWADIVRTRIQLARDRTTLKPTLRITYSVQQLLLMLSDLARECSRADIALKLLDPQVSQSANEPLRSNAAFPG